MDKNGGFKFPFPLHANESSVGSLLNTFDFFSLFSVSRSDHKNEVVALG